VGIDIEKIEPLEACDFPRYLNAAERAWAGSSARRFCTVWTRKEAVAKAAGTAGLACLPAVDTRAGDDRASYAGRLWRTVPLALGAAHVGHVATADRAGLAVTVEQLPAEALL
jgi:4'-phosphopantetheinyl transferase